ncbi:12570_t:CDS:2 [Ambispora leptoticha]|uniref:12570_t:CDS:1 n=1 Tax=Ambispora leptoticha TaxID=144679 RepID=A0A9N9DSU4_9GLOM|nr:12570_t:CDS:2 [Ambispora leptoticha]
MVGKCPGCGYSPRSGETRDIDKHLDLTRSRPCQALLQLTRAQNAPQTENATPPAPEGDFISFDENQPTLQPNEQITTGALVFAERYEGEAIQYDVNSMYVYEMLKKEASWPIASECAKEYGLKVNLIDESSNALICEKNTHISGKDMFEEWGNILYNIKKEGGVAGEVSKKLLVSLWGTLCEQRNEQNYDAHLRIKPFLSASARKRMSENVRPKRIHIDGFIVAGQINLKTDMN